MVVSSADLHLLNFSGWSPCVNQHDRRAAGVDVSDLETTDPEVKSGFSPRRVTQSSGVIPEHSRCSSRSTSPACLSSSSLESSDGVTRIDLSGWLLISSFVLWFPAAVLPARIWTAPHAERLTLIHEQRRRWQIVNLAIAAAAVLLVLGFAALAEPLRREGAPTLTDLSLALLLLGAPLWLASLVHRIVVEPEGAAWAGGLFLAWSVIANVAIIGLGAALVRSDLAGAWAGWIGIVLGALMLFQLLVTRDALPALYHVGPAVMGAVVLLS